MDFPLVSESETLVLRYIFSYYFQCLASWAGWGLLLKCLQVISLWEFVD